MGVFVGSRPTHALKAPCKSGKNLCLDELGGPYPTQSAEAHGLQVIRGRLAKRRDTSRKLTEMNRIGWRTGSAIPGHEAPPHVPIQGSDGAEANRTATDERARLTKKLTARLAVFKA